MDPHPGASLERRGVVAIAVGLTLALVACSEERAWPALRERAGDAELIVRRAAGQTFVSADRGNLARAAASTPAERQARFAEFLNDFPRELGLTGGATPVEFRPAAESVPLELGERALLTAFLEPVHRGASVIDRPQSAAYDAESGELRAVVAWAVDLATLPAAPAPDTAAGDRARTAFQRWLRANDVPEGRLAVRADPVVSAEARRAGYLAEYRGRDEAGAGLWIRALYDPESGDLLILHREERDDFDELGVRGPQP